MTSIAAVAIVGAGPYGLSVAAHLAGKGLEPLVFGPPMESWRNGMPRGMRLKSEGFASCLSDPHGVFTLRAFCASEALPYADLDLPVPVETFTAYGTAFQKRFVPQLDRRNVRHVRQTSNGFVLQLDDGASVEVRQLIVATGLGPYRHVPEVFAELAPSRLSHTSDRADYSGFAGQNVVVVGAGASAIDAAAALSRAGASVHLISRRAAVTFHAAGPRRWIDRFIAPMTPLGPGWKKLLCVKAPLLFRALPEDLRVRIVRRYLGPAPGWSARDDFNGKVAVTLSAKVIAARDADEGVELEIAAPDGPRTMRGIDHVVAGTGYDIDVRRLTFLDPALVAKLDLTRQAPRLSSYFETSVPGLYVVGTAAAYAFGPMLRFVCGAGFAARRVTSMVVAAERRSPRISSPRKGRSGKPLRSGGGSTLHARANLLKPDLDRL